MTGSGSREGGGLGSGRAALVRLSAALGSADAARRGSALDEARSRVRAGELEADEVEEALLQSYLFVGFPAALTAVEAWRERAGSPPAERDPLRDVRRVADWSERGEQVCRQVYGRAYPRLRSNVAAIHPALDRWMVVEGYGKVLGRPGLDLVDRELCIVGLLAAAGWGPQLHSHLRGALRVGATVGRVEAALEIGLEAAGEPERVRAARRVWQRVQQTMNDSR